MNTLKKLGAWIGFAYDVGRILFAREYDEPDTPPDDDASARALDDVPTTPIVHVSPDAARMISRSKPAHVPAIDEPLEGSIEARRMKQP
jgi:hypothetical protein